ncbi:hypothetical protein CCAX7_19730 [Capsulimonas corticalis]|uniref:Uncharacterized protein n=1 Tax=Capsulimonas corticalis TaxID=2219043 RepID=A0A402D2L2_9BACT|nr:glycosyltransferase family 4 protein [Capsulimonas corticalis]BDI29922.1 hypothetical protein CCAX7_19730 [Capsulimonas corticalis]
MRIALAASVYLNKNAGMAGVTWRLGNAMRDQGAEVDFYFLDELASFRQQIPNDEIFPWRLAFAPKIRTYDVVDSTAENTILSVFPKRPLLVSRSHGLENVAHIERLKDAKLGGKQLSRVYPLYRGSVRLWEEKLAFQRADLAFFLNEYDRGFAVDHFGVTPAKAHVVPNGLATQFLGLPFDPNPDVDGKIKIAWIGGYIPRKGIRYAEPAFAAVLRKHPHVSISLFGTGEDAAATLQHYPTDLHDRIHILPRYNQEELVVLLKGHSIYLLPSLSEGFPGSVLEAMANGLASVLTDIPGPTEFAKDEKNALLVPPRSSVDIETALNRLIEDASLRNRIRAAGYESVQRYSWKQIASDTLALYESGLSQRKG